MEMMLVEKIHEGLQWYKMTMPNVSLTVVTLMHWEHSVSAHGFKGNINSLIRHVPGMQKTFIWSMHLQTVLLSSETPKNSAEIIVLNGLKPWNMHSLKLTYVILKEIWHCDYGQYSIKLSLYNLLLHHKCCKSYLTVLKFLRF